MKGLLKYLAPFAPDQSGAAAVFYDMDCITVVCDAGGCIGNYCGFDEQRWFEHKSPIFSAGLRDMDAILGRDDKMVAKLKLVSDRFQSRFAVLVGTPVPAVIGTDYKALKKMAARQCQIPVLGIECSGTNLYDEGEASAYLELFRTFAGAKGDPNDRIIGIIGATPLELGDIHADQSLRAFYQAQGYSKVFCYGMGDGYEAIRQAGSAEKNVILSPAGIEAAEYLKKTFGTPYEAAFPILSVELKEKLKEAAERMAEKTTEKTIEKNAEETMKKVLVIHQQVIANAVRQELLRQDPEHFSVKTATFFRLADAWKQDGDIRLETEAELQKEILEGGYDLVIADEILKRAVRAYEGEWIHLPHFAVSGSRA